MFNTAIDNKKHILHISTNKCFFAVQIEADQHLYTDKLILWTIKQHILRRIGIYMWDGKNKTKQKGNQI